MHQSGSVYLQITGCFFSDVSNVKTLWENNLRLSHQFLKTTNSLHVKMTLNNHEWWACGWFSRGDPGHCQHILMKSRLCNDLMLMPLSKVACQLTLKFLHIFYVHLLIIWLRTSTHVILDSTWYLNKSSYKATVNGLK